MKWVGITGSIGSGKSTVAALVEDAGYPVIHADQVSHKMTEKNSEGLKRIVQEFGPGVILPTGDLNRPALADIVFADKVQLKKLESILHPLIQQQVKSWRNIQSEKGSDMAFYDIPLLFENQLQDQFDTVICVVADEALIIERVSRRSGLDEQEVRRRLSHQVPVAEKVRRSDHVIENNGSLEQLKVKVDQLVSMLKK